jgi:hypothetical protein
MFGIKFMGRPKKVKLEEVLKEEEPIIIAPEVVEEVEMFNGRRIIGRGEVEINGITRKTITTEEGSTYTL